MPSPGLEVAGDPRHALAPPGPPLPVKDPDGAKEGPVGDDPAPAPNKDSMASSMEVSGLAGPPTPMDDVAPVLRLMVAKPFWLPEWAAAPSDREGPAVVAPKMPRPALRRVLPVPPLVPPLLAALGPSLGEDQPPSVRPAPLCLGMADDGTYSLAPPRGTKLMATPRLGKPVPVEEEDCMTQPTHALPAGEPWEG